MVLELDEICGADPEDEYQPGDDYPTDGRQPDLKPEYCQYRDEGCRHAPSCLECPFPRCFYERKRGPQRSFKKKRNKKIIRLYHAGKTKKQLAARFKLTERTIERIIRAKAEGKRSKDE